MVGQRITGSWDTRVLLLTGLMAQTDVEKAVDHLSRLILEEDDPKVR